MFGKQSALMQLASRRAEVSRHIKSKLARQLGGGGSRVEGDVTVVARRNKQCMNSLPRLICLSKTSAMRTEPLLAWHVGVGGGSFNSQLSLVVAVFRLGDSFFSIASLLKPYLILAATHAN